MLQYIDKAIFFWSKYCFCFSKSAEITMIENFNSQNEKKFLFIAISLDLFIAILLAKIARLTRALVRHIFNVYLEQFQEGFYKPPNPSPFLRRDRYKPVRQREATIDYAENTMLTGNYTIPLSTCKSRSFWNKKQIFCCCFYGWPILNRYSEVLCYSRYA